MSFGYACLLSRRGHLPGLIPLNGWWLGDLILAQRQKLGGYNIIRLILHHFTRNLPLGQICPMWLPQASYCLIKSGHCGCDPGLASGVLASSFMILSLHTFECPFEVRPGP